MVNFIINFFIFYCVFFFYLLYYKIQNLFIIYRLYLCLHFYDNKVLKISIYIGFFILLNILFFILYFFKYMFYIFIIFFNLNILKYLNLKKINYILYLLKINSNLVLKVKLLDFKKYNALKLIKKEYEYCVIILGDFNYFVGKYNSIITIKDYIYGYFDTKCIEQYFICYIFFTIAYLKIVYTIFYKWLNGYYWLIDTKITQIYMVVHRNEKYTIKFILKSYKNKLLWKLYNFKNNKYVQKAKFWKKQYFLKKRMNYIYYKYKRIITIFIFVIKNIIKWFFNYIKYLYGTYILNPIFFFYVKNGGHVIVYFFFLTFKYIKSFLMFYFKLFYNKFIKYKYNIIVFFTSFIFKIIWISRLFVLIWLWNEKKWW